MTLKQLLPPQLRLLRTVPTPTRHVEEEEGMASGLPTAWFRVSRGCFEFLSAHPALGTGWAQGRGTPPSLKQPPGLKASQGRDWLNGDLVGWGSLRPFSFLKAWLV